MTVDDIEYVKSEMFIYGIKEGYLDFPKDFSFNPINLLSYDFPWLILEEEFFRHHPEIGNFTNWVILGTAFNATKISVEERMKLLIRYNEWDEDKLPERTTLLRKMLEKKYDERPAIFYIHCFSGHDRTGELSGAYMMKYLDWNFPDLWEYSCHIDPKEKKPREMEYIFAAMMNWYCFYLEFFRFPYLDHFCDRW